jgi:hypothetical protein
MNYGELELDIVARLVTLTNLHDAEVVPMPENQAAFKTPYIKPRVTVSWNSSDFMNGKSGDRPPGNATDGIVQEETIDIHLEIQARDLRGTHGIYNLIEEAKKRLVNYEPLNGELDKIKLKVIKYDAFQDNVWTYLLVATTVGKVVGDYSDEDGPLLEELTFDQSWE